MLKFFRKHARGWFMIAVIGIIIIVFVLYFGSSRGSRTANAIATVDKRLISESEFHNEYEKLMDMARLRLGAKLTPEILKKMDLKRKAYDNLLNRQIIIAKAADLKIQVSDEELKNTIMSMPVLQTNGTFDERKYRQILRYNKLSAEDFETLQKADMIANKIESIVREGIKISDQEIYDLYALQNRKININFVQIFGKDIKKKITPSETELEDYLKRNSNLFRVAEQVKIKYIFFPSDSFSPNISDSDIRDYYSSNKDKYKTKDGKQLSLADVKGSITKELKSSRGMLNAYTEAKKAHDIIYQEDKFEAYDNKNNLKIHDVDFFSINNPPPEFASIKTFTAMLLDLQKDEISKVMPAENGYYLLKIIDKKPPYLPKLNTIENEVKHRFIESETQILAEKGAQSILENTKSGETFDKIAGRSGLKVNETGFFQPGNTIPKLGSSQDASEILLQLSINKPYAEKPLFINNAYVILKLKEVSKLDEKDFEAKKAMYKKILISLKREEAMQTWLEGNKAAMIKEKRVRIKKNVEDL
ncbi:MAG: SurA N-terminal domain-containing protein [Deltaproteobacteria bacterium]|nr:SurA N-terminal domain-containing protein [Deltaproteobacteria bacterium]